MSSRPKEEIRALIESLVREYHSVAFAPSTFEPGASPVPVSGKVFDSDEMWNLVDSGLEFWLTTGRYSDQFEAEFATRMGVKHALLCNSGSSANLLALTALTSPRLKDRALKPGDEVLTSAVGFPTTVNPIIQNGLVPRLVDVELGTYNPTAEQLMSAVTPRTRCIMLAHALGNPFRADVLEEFADANDIYLIEDTCDAVGAMIGERPVGSFGDLSTTSFYPAHHITMGEGGCVLTRSLVLKKIVESFRDWGRDCWCPPGKDNTCGKRFDWTFDGLPPGYDHKYVYSHIGYNLKLTDMQAAVGVAQLRKLDRFVKERRDNWSKLYSLLNDFSDYLVLPTETPGTYASWFGFPITVRSETGVKRNELIRHLESHKIATRLLFGGNIARQPAYSGVSFLTDGDLPNANRVARDTFWVGVYPGLGADHLNYVHDIFSRFEWH
ncbi:MAG: lipopolysaccharide biosynthesis protein RfbH [Oxalobacteraceae bacterium]|nr:lipopolysaccharide biosynthesis protein RfbH [Oxalobacteraceae bacterium]